MRRFLLPVLAALISAAVVASISIAGSGTVTGGAGGSDPTKSRRSGPPPTMAEVFKKAQDQRNASLDRVAKRLDISGDRLRSALDEVMRDQLDAAVKANRLTDAQRDAILACKAAPLTCDRSNLPAFGPRGFGFGPGFGPGFFGGRDALAALAKKLGKDEDDVRAAFMAERRERGGRWPHDRGHHGPAFGPRGEGRRG
jgi:hypothetical protein